MENILDQIAEDNFWHTKNQLLGQFRGNYVDQLDKQSRTQEISAVIGVRRSGKSTILKQYLQYKIEQDGIDPRQTLYINLENPRLAQHLKIDRLLKLLDKYNEKIADNRKHIYVVFDEIQVVHNWESLLRGLVENAQRDRAKYFITGSSAKLLAGELATKLGGRYLKTEVFPLSYQEYIQFTKHSLEEYLSFGGFPRAVFTEDYTQRTALLQEYFQSILLRDVVQRHSIRETADLRELSSYLFSNIANLVSSSRIKNIISLTPQTIHNYFDYLQDAYLGFFLPKFAYSVKKQIYNPKKFYAIDTGLQTAAAFANSPNLGAKFENLVFLELRRIYSDLYYWADANAEIDFVVRQGYDNLTLINAVYQLKEASTLKRELAALNTGMGELGVDKAMLIVGSDYHGKQELRVDNGSVEVKQFQDLARQPLL